MNSAIQRGCSAYMTEILEAYVSMHNLMPETLALYKLPHVALGDHLMAIGDVTTALDLNNEADFFYMLTLKNFEKCLGNDHLKTAYASLFLAMVHRDLDEYDKARLLFSAAYKTIQLKHTDLDKKWFAQVVVSFNQMMQREKVEDQFMQGLDELTEILRQERFDDFDILSRTLSDKLASVFPPDHFNFTLLYRRTAQGLGGAGRTIESMALSNLATYLDAKLKDKEDYNRAFDQTFPQFQQNTMITSALW